MVSVSPWSVKGVEPEAREAAKRAARRSAMTVGQWLSHTIRAAADQQIADGCQQAMDASTAPNDSAVTRLSDRLENIEKARRAEANARGRSLFGKLR